MTGKDLFEAMSFIDERFIDEAERGYPTRPMALPWIRVTSIAACLCLIMLSLWCIHPLLLNPHETTPPTTLPLILPEGFTEVILYVEDFLFWLTASVSLFLLVQIGNKGVLRFYIFLGCGLGAVCYFLTITKLLFPVFLAFFRISGWILSKCCLIFEIIMKIIKIFLIFPLKKIWEGIKMVCNNI